MRPGPRDDPRVLQPWPRGVYHPCAERELCRADQALGPGRALGKPRAACAVNPRPAEVFAWAAQLHRAAGLMEEHAAGRDMTVREVLAEMPDGRAREELASLLSLPPVAGPARRHRSREAGRAPV